MKRNVTVAKAKEHFNAGTDLANRLGEIYAQLHVSDLYLATKMSLSLPDSMESILYNRLSGPATELIPKNILQDVMSLLKRINLAQGEFIDGEFKEELTKRGIKL